MPMCLGGGDRPLIRMAALHTHQQNQAIGALLQEKLAPRAGWCVHRGVCAQGGSGPPPAHSPPPRADRAHSLLFAAELPQFAYVTAAVAAPEDAAKAAAARSKAGVPSKAAALSKATKALPISAKAAVKSKAAAPPARAAKAEPDSGAGTPPRSPEPAAKKRRGKSAQP